MSGVVDAVSGILGGIGDAISGVVNAVGGIVEGIGDAISGAVESIGNTVQAILKDPLPTLLQVGGAMVGIPPYVTAAVITAARGGNLEDMAKSAAISYATTSFMTDTQIGADIKNYTTNAWSGDITDAMMEKFDLPADTAIQIGKVASASLNSSLVGGISAVLTGKSVAQGLSSGFTSGLAYASTDSYFNSINKDPNWGFSDKSLSLIKGATSTALNTIVSGKGDPSQALGNYIAYATINMGASTLGQAAKDAYKVFMTDTDAAKKSQDDFNLLNAEVQTKAKEGETLHKSILKDIEDRDKVLKDEFTPFKEAYDKLKTDEEAARDTFNEQKQIFVDSKWAYDNYDAKMKADGWITYSDGEGGTGLYKKSGGHYETRDDRDGGTYQVYVADRQEVDYDGNITFTTVKTDYNAPTQQSFADAANAAAPKANAAATTFNEIQVNAKTLLDANQPMLDGLNTSKTKIDADAIKYQAIVADINTPDGKNLAQKLKDAATVYQTKYDAWSKTKEAADRSAENYTKALADVATRDVAIDALNSGAVKVTAKNDDGSWTLSNGMTLTNQGKFIQDGVQLFTNAAGIPQKVMDFKAADGSNVDFSDTAGRLLSETDAVNICKRDYGFTPTEEEAANLAGSEFTNKATAPITALADQKAKNAYSDITGKQPTTAELDAFRKSGNVVTAAQDEAINGLDLPSDYSFPDQDTKVGYGKVYAANRLAFGKNYIFEWTDPKTGVTGKYTTESDEEKTARVNKMLANAQSRINMMPASGLTGAGRGFLNVNDTQQIINMMAGSNVVGGGRGFVSVLNTQALIDMMPSSSTAGSGRGIFGGPPAGVENIYYGKKDGNVYVDTRTYDELGNLTGGSLNLASDKIATAVRATNWIEQAQATGAQGVGELLQNFANAAALYTGANMDNTVYNVGKAIEQWGKDRDGADIVKQDANMESVVRIASLYKNPMDQARILFAGAKENPLSMMSSTGKELIQEMPGWIAASIAGVFMAPMAMGVGATLTVKAAISAGLDALESMGAGGREAYDAARKSGLSEEASREKGMINGAFHALMTAPAEFIADRLLLGHFVKGLSTGTVNYAAKAGSTIAINALSETLEAIPQNLSTQYLTTGTIDLKAATAGALYEGMIGGTTVSSVLGAKSINDAAIVAKDYAGNNVTLRELMDSSKNVDLKTFDSSANIGLSNNGGTITLGALTAVGQDLGIDATELKSFLPSSVTDYKTVVYKAADGTAITLGNIDSILSKNSTLDFNSVLNDVYTTPSAEFKTVFNPSVLNGSATFQSATDWENTAKTAGFPNYAAYQKYNGDVALYQNAQNTALAKAAGFPDYGSYTKFNGDKTAYNANVAAVAAGFPDTAASVLFNGDIAAYNAAKTAAETAQNIAIKKDGVALDLRYDVNKDGKVTSADSLLLSKGTPVRTDVDASGAKTAATLDAEARAAGFPNNAAYTQYGGDVKAYSTAQTNAANLQTATAAGFPDFASYTQYGGNISAYNTAQTDAANLTKAKTAGFPDYASYTQFKGDVAAYTKANEDAANIRKATDAGFPDYATFLQYNGRIADYTAAKTAETNRQTALTAGFPDYATYTQYNGNKAVYTAALSDASNTALATKAGFPDFNTYTLYGGDKKAYDTALTDTANTQKATAAGFPNYAAYTQYNGDVNAYNADSAAKIAGWKDAAEQTKASTAGYTDPAAYATYLTNTANTQKATTAGFPDYATYTQYNGDVAAYNTAKAASTVTPDAVSTAINNAIAGIQFPAGITAADVAAQIKAALAANPNLTVADVTGSITAYMTAHPGLSAAEVNTAISAATKDLATKKDIETAISGIKFPAGLTAADVAVQIKTVLDANPSLKAADVTGAITEYMTANPGLTSADVSTAITNATKNLATKDDIATAIAGITLPAGVTMDSVVTAIKNFAALNPTLSSADVTAAVKDYMTANPSITSADVNTAVTNATKGLATKADIATAIAGITLPAGITKADVTTAIEDYMASNPGLSATDVTKAVSEYMTANPGITAADVSASIDAATKGLATKADIDAAIAGIVFPAGLSKADVAAEIKAAMDANPGLSAADVTESITAYMTANPGLTAADVSTAIANGTKNFVTNTQLDVKLGTLTKEAKAQFDSLSQGQKDIVKAQTKMGVDINAAINDASRASTEQIANVRTDLTRDITNVQTQFNARVDELMLQGQTYQAATNAALQELGTGVSGLQTSVTDIQEKQKADALQAKRAASTSSTSKNLTSALSMIAPAAGALGLVDTSTPGFKDIGYKNIGDAKFESILSPFEKMVKENVYAPKQTEQQTQQQPQQVAPVNQELDPQKEQQGSDYFNYGTQNEIDQMLGSNPGTQMLFSKAGGLATPLMAGGGSTRYGRYAGGGLPLVEHSGKARLDFRTGNAVTGPGDGQSDDIPAMLADGEFVFPADVVAALGNGSTKAGSDKLYDMMHSIRAYHRSAKPKDLPPPAKQSPLDYLTKTKARR